MELTIQSKKQGAELTSICYKGRERLHQGKRVLDEKGQPYWGRQAPILFPIVGQIQERKNKNKRKHVSNGTTWLCKRYGL